MSNVRRSFRQPRNNRASMEPRERFIPVFPSESASPSASPSPSVSASPSPSPSSSPSSSPSPSPSSGSLFSLEHVAGIGGNFAGEPQGLAFDVTTQMLYAMSNNSGNREVKKINLSGTTLATNTNQGGSTLSIQDGLVKDGKVYVPRTNNGVGELQEFDLDLNFIQSLTTPAIVNLTPAVAFAHGSWWFTKSTLTTLYRVSEDLSTVEGTYDLSEAWSSSYSGLAWYGNFMFGAQHTLGTQIDVWYWDGSAFTLHQEISTAGLDLFNGLAIDETNNILYGSSRTLSDDIQKYNLILN